MDFDIKLSVTGL